MQTLAVFLVITSVVAIVTVGLAYFYTRVSSAAEDSHWITRTSIVAYAIAALVVLATVSTLLTLIFDHYPVAYIPLTVAKVALLVQLAMAALLFALPATRQAALDSAEGRVLTVLFNAAVYLFVLAARILLRLFKLSAKGNRKRRGGLADDMASPYGYHGYESHVERSERIRGKFLQ